MSTLDKIILEEEASKCLLCHNASCTKACKNHFDPARMLRSIRFQNEDDAHKYVDFSICQNCSGDCEEACIRYDNKIRIKKVASLISKEDYDSKNIDLGIDFLGFHCINPFFLSSSVVASDYEMCKKALDLGWGGIVLKTIGFYIPDEVSPRFSTLNKEGQPFIGFKNLEQISDHSIEYNLNLISDLKSEYPDRMIIASIMGGNEEEWAKLARLVSDAGADAIECNFSCPQMSKEGMGSDVGASPELVSLYSKAVKENSSIPVLAKMTPNITDMTVPALAAINAGADGIASINTIKSLTGIDLDNMESFPNVNHKTSVSGYSGRSVKPIALRFIHDMKKCRSLTTKPISGIGGIETWADACEFIALGCENIQITTAVMQYGYRIIDDLISGTKNYMYKHGYKNLTDFLGKALDGIVPADELDRQTVEFPRFDKDKCIGCGRCYISCYDGGHQAIEFGDETGNKPKLNKNCVGCQLCMLVCPVNAITKAPKRVLKRR